MQCVRGRLQLPLVQVSQAEVAEDDGTRLAGSGSRDGRSPQNPARLLILTQEQRARPGESIELRRGERTRGWITRSDVSERGLGCGQCRIAPVGVTEHGVRLGGVQVRQAGQHIAGRARSRVPARDSGQAAVSAARSTVTW